MKNIPQCYIRPKKRCESSRRWSNFIYFFGPDETLFLVDLRYNEFSGLLIQADLLELFVVSLTLLFTFGFLAFHFFQNSLLA